MADDHLQIRGDQLLIQDGQALVCDACGCAALCGCCCFTDGATVAFSATFTAEWYSEGLCAGDHLGTLTYSVTGTGQKAQYLDSNGEPQTPRTCEFYVPVLHITRDGVTTDDNNEGNGFFIKIESADSAFSWHSFFPNSDENCEEDFGPIYCSGLDATCAGASTTYGPTCLPAFTGPGPFPGNTGSYLITASSSWTVSGSSIAYHTTVAQVDTFTPANVEVGDVFTLTASHGMTTAPVSFTATAATAANVAAGLISAWNASGNALITPITATGTTTVILTADVPGHAFSVASSTTNHGGGANTQTLNREATVANSDVYNCTSTGTVLDSCPVPSDPP